MAADPRNVLVTGTSTGIGRALALRLDELGFRVFAAVRTSADASAWRSRAAGRIVPVMLEVTDGASIARARDEIAKVVGAGGLAALVNNAGTSFRAPLELVSLERLRDLFEVNVFGALAVTQTFLPLLRRARGRIVNISSITALLVTPFHGPYSSTKVTLGAMSDALRLELRPSGVHVSVMIVGGVRTALWDKVARLTADATEERRGELTALYGDRQQRALDYFMTRGRAGMSPEDAARSIARALTDRRPRNVYLVGRGARRYWLLHKLVPGRVRDWMILRQLG